MINARAGRLSTLVLSTFVAAGCGLAPDLGEDTSPPENSQPTPSALTTFTVRLENVAPFTQLKSGVFNTRVGGSAPGPLAPGEAFEFSFTAGKGQKLSFATMFGQSNDWIFGFGPEGLDLYENDQPRSGDVTSYVSLWDVGTEVDEEPAVGPHTGPNQASSIDGPGALDPNSQVRKLAEVTTLTNGRNFALPPVASMIRVSLRPDAATRRFTVRIENVSKDTSTLYTSAGYKPVRLSPGVWTLTPGGEPLFTEGQRDRGQGLEALAEGGQVTTLSAALTRTTGVGTPISPGVFVVHSAAEFPLFNMGDSDRGVGLRQIAESGNVMPLLSSLSGRVPAERLGSFTLPEGATQAGAARPGSAYTFQVKAKAGDRLSLATMFGMSNDWIFSTGEEGVALFDGAGRPISGDLSKMLFVYDVGTELDEELAVGPNTGPQQETPESGLRDNPSRIRAAVYSLPASSHLKLTISH